MEPQIESVVGKLEWGYPGTRPELGPCNLLLWPCLMGLQDYILS
jgi:hypothetical protein